MRLITDLALHINLKKDSHLCVSIFQVERSGDLLNRTNTLKQTYKRTHYIFMLVQKLKISYKILRP